MIIRSALKIIHNYSISSLNNLWLFNFFSK